MDDGFRFPLPSSIQFKKDGKDSKSPIDKRVTFAASKIARKMVSNLKIITYYFREIKSCMQNIYLHIYCGG